VAQVAVAEESSPAGVCLKTTGFDRYLGSASAWIPGARKKGNGIARARRTGHSRNSVLDMKPGAFSMRPAEQFRPANIHAGKNMHGTVP
jgi:hypothetical protein